MRRRADERRNQMAKRYFSVLRMLVLAVLMVAIAAGCAQKSSGDFTNEPDKSMAKGHEAFVKGDMNKAADYIHKAAAYVKGEADKVAKDAQGGVKKAGDKLDKLGEDVKKGTVKSGDELKKTYARVDHELAGAWYKTAAEAKKSGKDANQSLEKAGEALENAATWSGTQLKEGARAAIEAVKKLGKGAEKGAKAGAKDVDKLFKDIGGGIEDLGRKL
jgi:hypothetical protein